MKVVSGGQTGVDRAALDVALTLGMEIGGWCPRDRWAEDGIIPERYTLIETRSSDVHVRTQRNVETSSATLVLSRGSPIGGTRYTVEIAQSIRRPLLVVDVSDNDRDPVALIVDWLEAVKPPILNIAGPRESGAPGIADEVARILKEAFVKARVCPPPMPAPVPLKRFPSELRARAANN